MAAYQVVSKGRTRIYNTEERKMNKRTAIKECKELWKEIEESGLSKKAFLDSPDGEKWQEKNYIMNCPLCEYSDVELPSCPKCPLVRQYGKNCYKLGFKDDDEDDDKLSTPEFFEAIRGLK